MAVLMAVVGTATRAEVFCVPDDYPEFETEDGTRISHGWYWWYLQDDGCPDTYPSGPFGSSMEAMADWDADGSWEQWCEVEEGE